MTGWHPIVRSGAFRAVSAALLFAHVIFSGPVLAEQRIALVVGNSQYGDEIVNLANPANDANLIGAALRRVGFDVKIVLDADQRTFKIAIRDFYERLIAAGPDSTALFYYAGHGLQVSGKNYLVPVQAVISAEADVDLEAIEADVVLRQMGYAGARVMVVILDACRNNPLTRGFRSGTRGLARMEAPSGSYVAYSTAPGDVTVDGTGDYSPYAAALAEAIAVPGDSIEDTFRNVRVSVAAQTGNKQVTWDYSALTAPFYFVPQEEKEPAQVAATSPASATTDADFEMTFWNSIKDRNDPEEFEAYLSQFPNGKFAPLVELKIKKLRGSAEQTPPPATTGVATLEIQSMPSNVGPASPVPMKIEDMDHTFTVLQSANVRAGPGTDSPIIGRLDRDQTVSVTGKVVGLGWYRIDHGGKPGFVIAKVLAEAAAVKIVAARPVPVEPRIALVIGNSDYTQPLGALKNPANDAKLISKSLKSVGFQVATLLDADQRAMKRAISDFGAAVSEAGSSAVALFFYAGHGIQVDGINYLIPVGAVIERKGDVDLEAIEVGAVLKQLEYVRSGVNIVVLDACRNNPLRSFRSADRGLAQMVAPDGSFVAYSTAPGDVAVDGEGANSPFAVALAEEMQRPGSSVYEVFQSVGLKVREATGNKQISWINSSMIGNFYFVPEAQ